MGCDCKHNHGGECRRFPKVTVTVMGKNAWAFPPADCECGEKAAKPTKAEPKRKKTKGAEQSAPVEER